MIRFLPRRGSRLADAELYEALRLGERRAFDHLYRHALPMATTTLTQMGCPLAEVDDLFQDALLALHQNIVDGRYVLRADTKVTTYLVRLCRNRWIDRTRRVAYRRTESVGEHARDAGDPDDGSAMDELMEHERRLERLDAAFALLGERCQHLLRRFYFDRVPLAEIAEERGITPPSAKNEKYRCMQRLRKAYASATTPHHA